jgi:uncharacterized protein
MTTAVQECAAAPAGMNPADRLLESIEHAAHLLPSQGPITAFVHHNTLHAFEDVSFDEGVRAGGRLFGCHAYLAEEQYRQKLSVGRIRLADLEAVLLEELGDEADRLVAMFGTRYALRLAMLQFPLQSGPPAELRWMIAETDALRRFRPEVSSAVRDRMIEVTRRRQLRDHVSGEGRQRPVIDVLEDVWEQFDRRTMATWSERTWEAFALNFLWRVCRHGVSRAEVESAEPAAVQRPRRHRDLLLEATGADTDLLVDEPLIRFCAAFVDQGFSEWELPGRQEGFYRSFLRLHAVRGAAPTRWAKRLQRVTQRLLDAGTSVLESIFESLDVLGVGEDERDQFILQSLLALRGWAGMIRQLETNAEWVPRPAPAGTLVEFLAVRLILDRLAVQQVAREGLGFDGPLDEVRPAAERRIGNGAPADIDCRAFTVFQLAQVRGWKPEDLQHLSSEQWQTLVREIEAFSPLERRRVFHLAFERKYRNEALDALIAHSRRREAPQSELLRPERPPRPAYQLVCCIDDREESLRRHLEEVDPDCETLSMAGFYGVAMYYRGVTAANFQPLCPNTIKPRHYVTEKPLYSYIQSEQRRAEARRRIGRATRHAHLGTRTFLGGLLTGLFGSLTAFPLVGRVLFPRLTARLRRRLGGIVGTPGTELHLERSEPEPGPDNGHVGYTVDEMAGIVETGLRALGLAQPELIARLVLICGHGSASLNNPHESAYNCGACSGGRGGPNARAFARMANDVRVRHVLADRGLLVPEDTCFVGCFHNTCDDQMTWFDLDDIPIRHRQLFERARAAIDEARQRNAHERCRRFESVDLSISPAEAARHVEARAEDLSQARPEYNHATNALCLLGRRAWSRGLFLDRRAFLTSYDPAQDDPQGSILERTLQAVIPVCAGISLEYYFSTVDVEGWGCGSKLPHNITSLLGVMTGAASDLRPGLSAQMVEIHEPLRILFVIETTAPVMRRIIDANEGIARLVRGGWVQLALFDAADGRMQLYREGDFVPYGPETFDLPTAVSSRAWYGGWREDLGFASVESLPSIAPLRSVSSFTSIASPASDAATDGRQHS